jgi:FtsZ-interacting cell division protein ZipA
VEDWLTDWISNPTSILAAIAVIALLWHGARWTQRMEAGQQTFRDGLKELRDGLKELGSATG